MASLHTITRQYRAALLHHDAQAAQHLINAYRPIAARLEAEAIRLSEKLESATKAGASDTNLLYRQQRIEAFQAQIDREITKLHAGQTPALTQAQAKAAQIGVAGAQEQLSLSANFTRMSPKAVEHIVAQTRSGPLADLLAQLGPKTAQGIATELRFGIASGLNPRVIAASIRREMGLSLQRALTISRTEVIRASRNASFATYQSSGVVTQWEWLSARDSTTCAACWAMDGQRFDVFYEVDGHVNCRCSLAPVVTAIKPLPTKEAKWESLGAEAQQKVLGPARYSALSDGKATLDDFARITESPKWGRSVRQASLSDLGIAA